MTLEFDPRCGTSQPEDTLQVSLPLPAASMDATPPTDLTENAQRPVFRKFSGKSGWPSNALLVPGNSVNFTLETASDYVKEDQGKASSEFGFRCVVTGYDAQALISHAPLRGHALHATGLLTLEREVAFLAATCASSLLKPDLGLPPPLSSSPLSELSEEEEEDLSPLEDTAQQTFAIHQPLLSKGFALAHPPTISQALEGVVPFAGLSTERMFLQDFVGCSPVTSGGRLAQWLQPESYVDTRQCELVLDENRDELKCGWPTTITIVTKDQRGFVVVAPDLKVELQAVPVERKDSCSSSAATSVGGGATGGGGSSHRSTPMTPLDFLYANESSSPAHNYDFSSNFLTSPAVVDVSSSSEPVASAVDHTYGGHPPPNLDVAYEVTVKDKMSYTAICIMKHYENYSFEELRFATPPVKRPSEKMLVSTNNDGTFTAGWTPGSVGLYDIHVRVDGYPIGEVHRVQVKEAPRAYGLSGSSKNYSTSSSFFINGGRSLTRTVLHHSSKRLLAFRADYSSGLRLRVAPSLQAEQVGLIQTDDVISFVEEVHNDDGVWLRLAAESTRNYCPRREVKGPTTNGIANGVGGSGDDGWKSTKSGKPHSSRKSGCRKCHGGAAGSGEMAHPPQEAWVLQHNQHTGKSFLIPVEDDDDAGESEETLRDSQRQSCLPQRGEDSSLVQRVDSEAGQPMELNAYASPSQLLYRPAAAFPTGVVYTNIAGSTSGVPPASSAPPVPIVPPQDESRVPAFYFVIKCGSSGHNIRSRPSLKASPIGMLILGNTVRVLEEVVNCEGTWVRLDAESASRYCHTPDVDAWSLAKNAANKTTYLVHESESRTSAGGERGATVRGIGAIPPFGSPLQPGQAALWEAQNRSGGAFSSAAGRAGFGTVMPSSPRGVDGPIGDLERKAFQPALGIPFADAETNHYSAVTEEDPLRIPPFGQCPHGHSYREDSDDDEDDEDDEYHSPPSTLPPPPLIPNRKESLSKDIPPELHGVSVKELVKALGESRANGNGVTPPGTPPGTPRAERGGPGSPRSRRASHRSRSSSPSGAGQTASVASGGGIAKSPIGVAAYAHSGGKRRESLSPRGGSSPVPTPISPRRESPLASNSHPPSPSSTLSRKAAVVTTTLATPLSATSSPVNSSPLSMLATVAAATAAAEKATDLSAKTGGDANEASGTKAPSPAEESSTSALPASPLPSPSRHPRSSPKVIRRIDRTPSNAGERSGSGDNVMGSAQGGGVKASGGGSKTRPLHSSSAVRTVPSSSASRVAGVFGAAHHMAPHLRPALPQHSFHASVSESRDGGTPVGATPAVIPTALTPSKAECQRAVFAAFLWHEGLVHDAMACATFLKFQPNLTKPVESRRGDRDDGGGEMFSLLLWHDCLGVCFRVHVSEIVFVLLFVHVCKLIFSIFLHFFPSLFRKAQLG